MVRLRVGVVEVDHRPTHFWRADLPRGDRSSYWYDGHSYESYIRRGLFERYAR